ncbi:polyketide cyclase / dehydrase and lipid transport [Pseudonocardia sp.]|uniref:polyketide cyclase / dehydrase and lipid transport n=1 Tax=Pseudonocardia sp. TaxID=60912 RepID=UPI003D0AE34B
MAGLRARSKARSKETANATIDVVDELFVVARPEVVAAEFAGPARWRELWPDLDLEVVADRGAQGLRWTATGALVGSMEVWLEPVLDGTLLHYYLRAELPAGRPGRDRTARRVAAEARRRQHAAKALAFALKHRLEAGRAPGEPPG